MPVRPPRRSLQPVSVEQTLLPVDILGGRPNLAWGLFPGSIEKAPPSIDEREKAGHLIPLSIDGSPRISRSCSSSGGRVTCLIMASEPLEMRPGASVREEIFRTRSSASLQLG